MFQLHLPRYSTKEILRTRLITAVQNAGTRSDGGGGASKQKFVDLEVSIPESASAKAATYVLQPTPACVGHLTLVECVFTEPGPLGIGTTAKQISGSRCNEFDGFYCAVVLACSL